MNIEVQDLTAVDKEVIITAPLSEISEQVEKKLREYQKQIQMPGFRPGKVPMGMVRKRFYKDVEAEEAAKFVQTTFEKDVVSEHKPIGESQLTDFKIEEDSLNATFKIGVRPEFELAEIEGLEVDKMVHDVTDEEVDDEYQKVLERAASFEETAEAAVEGMKVTADIIALDANGNEMEDESEYDQTLDLSADVEDDDMKPFRQAVLGKKAGEQAELKVDDLSYRIEVLSVESKKEVEINEDFYKAQSQDEATDEASYKAWLKSKIQEYYDKEAEKNFHSSIVEALIEKHPLDVPEVLQDSVAQSYMENLKQQMGGNVPDGFDIASIKNMSGEQILRDARWMFISEKLEEKFSDQVEIKAEDIDSFLAEQAAQYGMPADQLKQYYASNTQQFEQLRGSIREKKLFAVLSDLVKEVELSKEAFNEKMKEKEEAKAKAQADAIAKNASENEAENTEE